MGPTWAGSSKPLRGLDKEEAPAESPVPCDGPGTAKISRLRLEMAYFRYLPADCRPTYHEEFL